MNEEIIWWVIFPLINVPSVNGNWNAKPVSQKINSEKLMLWAIKSKLKLQEAWANRQVNLGVNAILIVPIHESLRKPWMEVEHKFLRRDEATFEELTPSEWKLWTSFGTEKIYWFLTGKPNILVWKDRVFAIRAKAQWLEGWGTNLCVDINWWLLLCPFSC